MKLFGLQIKTHKNYQAEIDRLKKDHQADRRIADKEIACLLSKIDRLNNYIRKQYGDVALQRASG